MTTPQPTVTNATPTTVDKPVLYFAASDHNNLPMLKESLEEKYTLVSFDSALEVVHHINTHPGQNIAGILVNSNLNISSWENPEINKTENKDITARVAVVTRKSSWYGLDYLDETLATAIPFVVNDRNGAGLEFTRSPYSSHPERVITPVRTLTTYFVANAVEEALPPASAITR